MARRKYDLDNDGDDYGLIGGEMTSATSAAEGCYDWKLSDECHEDADMLSGPEYAYLGHFRKSEYARQGHNDMQLHEPGLPPMDVPSGQVGVSPAQTQRLNQGPVGSAVNKAIGSAVTGVLGSIF